MLKIITSGALAAALEKILPIFSKEYDISYSLSYGSSFGEAHDSIPSRIKNGENFDFYFLAEGALLKHAKEGIVDINSKVNSFQTLLRYLGPKLDKNSIRCTISDQLTLEQLISQFNSSSKRPPFRHQKWEKKRVTQANAK